MSATEAFITGLSQSIGSYLGQKNETQQKSNLMNQQAQLDMKKMVTQQAAELEKGKQLEQFKGSLEDVLTPDMAEKAIPGYGAKMVQDYNTQRPNKPLTLKEGIDFLKVAQDKLNPTGPSKEDLNQDKLEKQYADRLQKVIGFRSGGLGLQDSKVNQAIDLRVLLNQYYDPKTDSYNVPPAQHSELALGLARLVSPTGQVGVELEKLLRQKTGREALANALIYAGFDPTAVGGSTQSVIKMFKDSIDRQGETAERLRDKYISGLKGLYPTGLKQDRIDRLNKAEMTNSFREMLKESPGFKEHTKKEPVGKVHVIDSKGRGGWIPSEQLEGALKNGYTQG